ncbi:MAPEG family protein [Vibrio rarus]|uniref:MAPEG family protein n=1 Tax=Vibrio rarus TaxID=413403 RepID=UPI0021C4085E|nr:MAPEG family protein [Vibrio rarus]
MNLLIGCLIIAALLPLLAKIPLAIAMHNAGGYDNHHPREQQAQLQGFGARALAAHHNAFESLIIFSLSILLAVATNTTTDTVQWLAIAHIGFRIAYHLLYLLNAHILRSVAWAIAIACSFAIIWQCIPN